MIPIREDLRAVAKTPAFEAVMGELGYEKVKRGRWIYDERNGHYYCSECHRRAAVHIDTDFAQEHLGAYCGVCGAAMDRFIYVHHFE